MIIDTHVHVVTADEENYPLSEKALASGADAWFRKKAVDAEELIEDMDGAGVDRAVLVQGFTAYGFDNSYAADAAVQHPDRLRALCTVSADDDFVAQSKYWINERGGTGIRLLASAWDTGRWLVGEDAESLWAFMAGEGWVLDCAVHDHELAPLGALARRFASMPVVVDHVAMIGLGGVTSPAADALWSLSDIANVCVKISPLLWEYSAQVGGDAQKGLAELIDHFGPARLLWGSNYTATALPSYQALVDTARDAFAAFGSDVAEQIQFGTADRLWWH